MSIAAGFLQLGNLAHDIVQGVVQLFAAVRHAVNFSMAMCEAALLRLKYRQRFGMWRFGMAGVGRVG